MSIKEVTYVHLTVWLNASNLTLNIISETRIRFVTLEDGTDRLSRNVGNKVPQLAQERSSHLLIGRSLRSPVRPLIWRFDYS